MRLSIFIVAISLFGLSSCKQHQHPTVDKYYQYLNSYQGDSLQTLLADDFKVTMNYSEHFYDRASFFSRYLKNYQAYNQKSKILKTISDDEPGTFLVEDNSDYLKYLKVSPPKWAVTIRSENGVIHEINVDTTETTRTYFIDLQQKNDKFTLWLAKKYPYESPEVLHGTEGLFLQRLKEYSETL
jgi:hypothetical protein